MEQLNYLAFCKSCGHPRRLTTYSIRKAGTFLCYNTTNKGSYHYCGALNVVPAHLVSIVNELEVTLNKLNTPKSKGGLR